MNPHVDYHASKNNIQIVMMVAWQREKQAQLSNHCYIISRTDTFKVAPPAFQTFNMHLYLIGAPFNIMTSLRYHEL